MRMPWAKFGSGDLQQARACTLYTHRRAARGTTGSALGCRGLNSTQTGGSTPGRDVCLCLCWPGGRCHRSAINGNVQVQDLTGLGGPMPWP